MSGGTNGRLPLDQVEGTVEAVNDSGVRVGGQWCNKSRFHPVDLPDVGATVRLQVDGRGYIHSVEVLAPAPTLPTSNGRERTITKLAVLKAAAHFAGLLSQTHEDVKSEHVLVLAQRWLEWIEEQP